MTVCVKIMHRAVGRQQPDSDGAAAAAAASVQELVAACHLPSVPCDALCQKTVTIPLRMFGTAGRAARGAGSSIPTQLHCYARLLAGCSSACARGSSTGAGVGLPPAHSRCANEIHDIQIQEVGVLRLRLEQEPGRNARLVVVNSSTITRAFPKHRITGWALLPGHAACVMFLDPPREDGEPPPAHRAPRTRPELPSFGPEGLVVAPPPPAGATTAWAVANAAAAAATATAPTALAVAATSAGVDAGASGGVAGPAALPMAAQSQQGEEQGQLAREGAAAQAADEQPLQQPQLPEQPVEAAAPARHHCSSSPTSSARSGSDGGSPGPGSRGSPGPGSRASPGPGSRGGRPAAAAGAERIVCSPVEDGAVAAQLVSMRVAVHSNAVLNNSNVSVPLLVFGRPNQSRVLPAWVRLYASVERRYALDLGCYHVRIAHQRSASGDAAGGTSTRIKLTLGSSGTLFKKFPQPTQIVGWSLVPPAANTTTTAGDGAGVGDPGATSAGGGPVSLVMFMRLPGGAPLPKELYEAAARCSMPPDRPAHLLVGAPGEQAQPQPQAVLSKSLKRPHPGAEDEIETRSGQEPKPEPMPEPEPMPSGGGLGSSDSGWGGLSLAPTRCSARESGKDAAGAATAGQKRPRWLGEETAAAVPELSRSRPGAAATAGAMQVDRQEPVEGQGCPDTAENLLQRALLLQQRRQQHQLLQPPQRLQLTYPNSSSAGTDAHTGAAGAQQQQQQAKPQTQPQLQPQPNYSGLVLQQLQQQQLLCPPYGLQQQQLQTYYSLMPQQRPTQAGMPHCNLHVHSAAHMGGTQLVHTIPASQQQLQNQPLLLLPPHSAWQARPMQAQTLQLPPPPPLQLPLMPGSARPAAALPSMHQPGGAATSSMLQACGGVPPPQQQQQHHNFSVYVVCPPFGQQQQQQQQEQTVVGYLPPPCESQPAANGGMPMPPTPGLMSAPAWPSGCDATHAATGIAATAATATTTADSTNSASTDKAAAAAVATAAAAPQSAGGAAGTSSGRAGSGGGAPDAGSCRELPLLPDLDVISARGVAGIAEKFLQVMSCVGASRDLASMLMVSCSRAGAAAVERMRVLYVFLQDACAARDARAASRVLDELLAELASGSGSGA